MTRDNGRTICMNQDEEELLRAIREGDIKVVADLVGLETSLDFEDGLGATPLIAAAENGKEDVMKLLLDCGASVDMVTKNGNTALRAATLLGHMECAHMLLEAGADPGLETARGTPLITAARKGDDDIARLLIGKGATVGHETRDGHSALLAAVHEGQLNVIQTLVKNGADPHASSKDGLSAVDLAEQRGLVQELAVLLSVVVQRDADRTLQLTEARREEAGKNAEQAYQRGLDELEAAMSDLHAETKERIRSLQAENDDLRARFARPAADLAKNPPAAPQPCSPAGS